MAEALDDPATRVPSNAQAPAPVPVLEYRSPGLAEPPPMRAATAADAALLLSVGGWVGLWFSIVFWFFVSEVIALLSLGAIVVGAVLWAVWLLVNRGWWVGASFLLLMVQIAGSAAAGPLRHTALGSSAAAAICLAGATAAVVSLLKEPLAVLAGILVALHLGIGLLLCAAILG